MTQIDKDDLMRENIQLRRQLLQLRQSNLQVFQRQKVMMEKFTQNLKKQFDKKLGQEKKIFSSRYNKMINQSQKSLQELNSVVGKKQCVIDELYGRIERLEKQKEQILRRSGEALKIIILELNSKNDGNEDENNKQIMKLYNYLMIQNAQLKSSLQKTESKKQKKQDKKNQKNQQKRQQKRHTKIPSKKK